MIKRIKYVLVLASILVGCKAKEEIKPLVYVDLGSTITALTEQSTESGATDFCDVKWSSGDRVLISDGTTVAEYTASPLENSPSSAGLSASGQATVSSKASDYYAVFPSDKGASAGPDGYKVVIPSSQTWERGRIFMPMVGKGGNGAISFKNAASVIKVTPDNICDSYDGVRVRKIVVSSESDNIAGACSISYDGESDLVLGEISEGSKSIILDCGEPGADFSETFYISLVPGNHENLSVKIISNGGGSQTFKLSASSEYKRSHFSPYQAMVNNLAIYEPANSYLIKHAGSYRFPVNTKGNGVVTVNENTHGGDDKKVTSSEQIDVYSAAANSVGNIKSISSFVISQKDKNAGSFDKSKTITDVKLEGSFITFTVPENFTPGNIFIGIHSAEGGSLTDGSCMWSWHIWINDQVEDVSLGSLHSSFPEVEILNMNMGSLQTKATLEEYAGVNSGLYYQWGRKDPFPPFNGTDATMPAPYSIDEHCTNTTQHRASEGVINHYPTVFYSGNEVGKEVRAWCTNALRDHWGAVPSLLGAGTVTHVDAVKTAFDPCPPGYQVMSAYVWKSISYNWSNSTDQYAKRNRMEKYEDEYMITKHGDKPVFPYDGARYPGSKTDYDGKVGNVASRGSKPYYWTASYYNNGGMNAVGVQFQEVTPEVDNKKYTIAGNASIKKSFACSVRAQKQ